MVLNKVLFAQKCVVYNKDTKKILILKRSDYKSSSANLWDFVGGSYDFGEDSIDGLKREGVEELRINLNEIHTINYYALPADKPEHTFIFGLSFCDNFEFEKKVPVLSNEHTEFVWVDIDELNDYEFVDSIKRCKDKIKPFIERFY
jgi:8-oxo-dGTP pyrophosphatase MutT (NUDIX family)